MEKVAEIGNSLPQSEGDGSSADEAGPITSRLYVQNQSK
jgi:hypothetical protein